MSECTMILLDNSEWMRNGDYARSRFEAQHEAAHTVLGLKSQNPESTVGVISLAGGTNVGVQVLCSPTDEKIKVMRAFADTKIGGRSDLATGLQVAQLALKYKPSHFKSRIVAFVGSPIQKDQKKLTKIAKLLRKNNVAVDIISMGEWETNQAVLEEFIQAVNKGDASHLIVVPREYSIFFTLDEMCLAGTFPEDAINNSPMGGGNQFAEYGGVNPELDPELAAAMQESILLAQANQEDEGKDAGNVEQEKPNEGRQEEDEEEAKMLAEAMEMSLLANEGENGEKEEDKKRKAASSDMLNPDFMKSLVQSMPGVDINNPEIQNLLNQEKDKKKKEGEEEKEDDEDKKDEDK